MFFPQHCLPFHIFVFAFLITTFFMFLIKKEIHKLNKLSKNIAKCIE